MPRVNKTNTLIALLLIGLYCIALVKKDEKLNINRLLLLRASSLEEFPNTIICISSFANQFVFIEFEKTIENEIPYINSALIVILQGLLFLNIELYSEIKKRTLTSKSLFIVVALVLLFFNFHITPCNQTRGKNIGPYIRYILFNLIAH